MLRPIYSSSHQTVATCPSEIHMKSNFYKTSFAHNYCLSPRTFLMFYSVTVIPRNDKVRNGEALLIGPLTFLSH